MEPTSNETFGSSAFQTLKNAALHMEQRSNMYMNTISGPHAVMQNSDQLLLEKEIRIIQSRIMSFDMQLDRIRMKLYEIQDLKKTIEKQEEALMKLAEIIDEMKLETIEPLEDLE